MPTNRTRSRRNRRLNLESLERRRLLAADVLDYGWEGAEQASPPSDCNLPASPIEEAPLLATGDWRVVGNLPYNISTPLLVRLFAHCGLIRDMHFMLQREVAKRLAAVPGTKQWGRLSVLAQFHCHIESLFDVPPESFSPAPKVHSCVVRFVPHAERHALQDPKCLDLVLRHAFSGRRKRISNALKSVPLRWQELSFPLDVRPDQLTVADYVAIANACDVAGDET